MAMKSQPMTVIESGRLFKEFRLFCQNAPEIQRILPQEFCMKVRPSLAYPQQRGFKQSSERTFIVFAIASRALNNYFFVSCARE
jgi:hypothetical protein